MDEMFSTNEDRIRERAYAIWESEGRPEGKAELHWFQAAAEINNNEPVQDAATGMLKPKRRGSRKDGTPPDPAGDQQKDPVPLSAPSDSEGVN